MSYQALYRKYRPVDFKEIVGQPVLVQTLKNAVTTDHISHAYLFSGPRGTGKTSTARVLAKAINCTFAKDGEPCNKCETCTGINNGSLVDYVEIDAASNNGVDEIRNIRSQIKYSPLVADYKIYVIDEAHMLSLGAFNALLKTLEEPPAYAIFILATTNPQKIPATIISRLQRYDFHRMSVSEIVEQINLILKREQLSAEPEALQLIAQLANGGMRDALSILDQAVTLSNNEITLDLVTELTGITKKELLFSYLNSIYHGEVKLAVEKVDSIIREGKDLAQFIHELIILLKEILLQKNGIIGTFYQTQELKKFEDIKLNWIYDAIKILNDQDQRLRQTVYGDLLVEIMTMQLANLANYSVEKQNEVTEEISQKKNIKHESKIQNTKEEEFDFQPITKDSVNVISGEFVKQENLDSVLKKASRKDLNDWIRKWEEVIALSKGELTALIKYTHPVAASKDSIIISFKFEAFVKTIDQRFDLQQELRSLLKINDVYGISDDDWPNYRKSFLTKINGSKQPKVEKKKTVDKSNNEQNKVGGLTPNMEAIIQFLGSENVKIIDD